MAATIRFIAKIESKSFAVTISARSACCSGEANPPHTTSPSTSKITTSEFSSRWCSEISEDERAGRGAEHGCAEGNDRHTDLLVLTRNQVAHDTVPGFLERFDQAYLTQLEDFVANLRDGHPAPITCTDGVAAQRIALAATRSLHERRTVAPDEI